MTQRDLSWQKDCKTVTLFLWTDTPTPRPDARSAGRAWAGFQRGPWSFPSQVRGGGTGPSHPQGPLHQMHGMEAERWPDG